MDPNSQNFSSIMFILLILFSIINLSSAGTCWLRRTQDSGKCNQLFTRNVTKKECCEVSGAGYTDRDLTSEELFYAEAFGHTVECVSCFDNCETANCGPGKRCIMKKGRPKCVCSPMCKTPARNSAAKKVNIKNINVINMNQNMKNLKRQNNLEKRQQQRKSKLLGDDPTTIMVAPFGTYNTNPTVNKKSTNANQRTKVFNGTNSRSNNNLNPLQTDSDNLVAKSDKLVLISSDINDNINSRVRHKNKKLLNKIYSSELVDEPKPSANSHSHQHQHHHHNHNHHNHRQHNRISNSSMSGSKRSNFNNRISSFDNAENNVENKFRMGAFSEDYLPDNRWYAVNGNHFYSNDISMASSHQYYNPVCGTDNKTYKTECQLKKRACRQENTLLTIAYKGHCQSTCKFVKCPSGKHCVEDQNSSPHCVVCQKCPHDKNKAVSSSTSLLQSKMVCGVDGVTYKSLCELKQRACLLGRAIPVAYRGPCIESATCENIKCKNKEICLTELTTHKPRCVTCSYKCPRARRPHQKNNDDHKICGNNNHNYHSWCHMMKDSCNTGILIDVKHYGACKNGERNNRTSHVFDHLD